MKKKNFLIVMVAVLFVSVFSIGFYFDGDPNADVAPFVTSINPSTADTIPPGGFPYATLFNFNYQTVPGMNGGTVGAMFFGGKYYFNRWNGTTVYRYNNNGPGGGPGTLADSLTYIGSCRDLATDGVFIYGGTASTTLYRFDPNTMATLKTFTLAGGATRALAWDPNRKGFWNTNFSGNIFFHDTNGVLVTQITSTLAGKYGLGFDSTTSQDSAFLWVWNQGSSSTTNELYKIHIQSGTVKETYIFTLTGASIGIAGGAEVIANVVPNKLVLLLNYQNFALVGYNLKNLTVTPPSWSEQNSGLTTALYSVSAVDDNVAWVCGAGGKVLRTTNKGQNWLDASGNLPATTDMYNIWGIDANTALVTGSPAAGSYMWRTTNGGANWTQVFFESGGFGDGIWMTSATNGFFYGDPVGGRWSLWKTSNGGVNWDSTGLYVPSGSLAGWNNAIFGLGTYLYFGTNGTSLYVSSNNGTTWFTQTTPAVNQYAIWFNNASVGLAGGANLYVTTNGGSNWATMTAPGTGNISGICGTGNEWWFTRQATSVYYTSNNGTNWTTQYTAPAGSFYHLTKARSGSTLWGVRSNGGISRYGTPITGVNNISSTVPENYSLSQNYPNPFNPVTKINFALPKAGYVTLKVYDVLGREVTTLVNGNYNAGTYTVDFNAANLASGMYFYKLEVNGFSSVKKMMLIK